MRNFKQRKRDSYWFEEPFDTTLNKMSEDALRYVLKSYVELATEMAEKLVEKNTVNLLVDAEVAVELADVWERLEEN